MKKLVILTLALVLVIGISSAFAANSMKEGTMGLSFGPGGGDFMVTGKFFAQSDLAILASFGLGIAGGDAKGTDIGLGVGVRKYLKVDDFAPFVGGGFSYKSTNDSNTKDLTLNANFGAEYFFHKQVSIEGSVGFGYGSSETKTTSTDTQTIGGFPVTTSSSSTFKSSMIGTQDLGLRINFYF